MLTAEQKGQAQRKLKLLNQEKAIEQQLRAVVKKNSKTFNDTVASMQTQPKKLVDFLKNITSNILPQKLIQLDCSHNAIVELQDKLKAQKERNDKQALQLLQEKAKYDNGVNQIKNTIVHIQKTVKDSVQEEGKKRKKIEDDLQKSLDEIREKIKEFEKESQQLDVSNVELKGRIDEIKQKLGGIEQNFKSKAQEKDEEVRKQKQQLTDQLRILESEVQKATQLNKEYSALQKKNFDNKVAVYLKTKKFPEFSSSFESSAQTIGSCKQELIKGVDRLNKAIETIENHQRLTQSNNNQYLVELKKLTEQKVKNEDLKKEKANVRNQIIELQSKLKEKKQKSLAS